MLLSWHDFPNPNFESSLTFLIQIWKVHLLSLSQFGKSTDLTFHNLVVKKEISFLMHILGVFLHIPILSTSVCLSHTILQFQVQTQVDARSYRLTLQLSRRGAFICTWQEHMLFRISTIIMQIRCRSYLVDHVLTVFRCTFFKLCICAVFIEIRLIK